MKKTSKIISLLLAVIMLLGVFTGCKKKETEEHPEFLYLPEYHEIEGLPEGDANYTVVTDDKMYFIIYEDGNNYDIPRVATEETNVETAEIDVAIEEPAIIEEPMMEYDPEKVVYSLYSCNLDGTGLTKLEGFDFPADNFTLAENGIDETYTYMSRLFAGEDGSLYITTESSETVYNVPANFNPDVDEKWNYESTYTTKFYLIKLNADGSEAKKIELTNPLADEDEYFYVNSAYITKDGKIYASNYHNIIAYDADGNVLYTIEDARTDNFITMADGSICVLGWDDESGNYAFYKLNDATKSLEKISVTEHSNVYSVFESDTPDEVFYRTENSVFTLNIKTDESKKLFDWLDCEVNPDNMMSFIQSGEDFIVVNETWENRHTHFDIIKLVKTPYSEVKEKENITIACNYVDWELRNQALEFNKKSDKYRIKLIDYSEYNTNEDYNAGMTKLNTEIIAGNIPDIFFIDSYNMPIEKYKSKGLLEDLTPYLNETFGEGAFIEHFMDTLRDENGKLYEAYTGFEVETAYGLKKIVGEGKLTFKGMNEAIEKLQEGGTVFGPYYSVSSALSAFVYRSMNQFVDWKTGECKFNTSEFADMLRMLKNFKTDEEMDKFWENYNWEDDVMESERTMLLSGKQLLIPANFSEFEYSREMFYRYNIDDISFVGYPGTGSSFVNVGLGFAMSSKSAHKEGAWEFIKGFMSEDYQNLNSWYFPTNKATFEKKVEEAMTPTFSEYNYNDMENNGVYYAEDLPALGYDVAEPVEVNPNTDDEPKAPAFAFPEYNKGQTKGDLFEEPKSWTYEDNTGRSIPMYSMTQEEYDYIMNIINSTDNFRRYDTSLKDIIDEEVQAFLSGQKSAEDTAAMIQSRAEIYVNEQK